MFYYNPRQKSVCSYAIPDFNYGVQHFSEDGHRPLSGMNVFNHDKFPGRFRCKRERLINDALGRNPRNPADYSKPKDNQLVCFNLIFNELKKKDFFSRLDILLDLLGFRDSGIRVNDDWLFIYDFFNEFRKFEIYLNFKDGSVTEINTYDYTGMTAEAKYPVCVEGFTSMFEEILQDLFMVNLSDGLQSDTVDIGNLDISYVHEHWPFVPGSKPLVTKVQYTENAVPEDDCPVSGEEQVKFENLPEVQEHHDGKASAELTAKDDSGPVIPVVVPEKKKRRSYSWVPEKSHTEREEPRFDSDFEYRPDYKSHGRYTSNREDMETVREKSDFLDSVMRKCGHLCLLLAFGLFMYNMTKLGFLALVVALMIFFVGSKQS